MDILFGKTNITSFLAGSKKKYFLKFLSGHNRGFLKDFLEEDSGYKDKYF